MLGTNFRTNLIILGGAIGAVSDITAAIMDSSAGNSPELTSISSMLSTIIMACAGGFVFYIGLKIYDQHHHRLFSNRQETESPTFNEIVAGFNADNGDDADRHVAPVA